jgi:Family of unknown function (DUF6236)
MSRPIFHVHDIGADDLVAWVAKPPACETHWKEFASLEAYHLPEIIERSVASALLDEGAVTFESSGSGGGCLTLRHKQLFNGQGGEDLRDLQRRRFGGESLDFTLARRIVGLYWAAAASDMYAARSMGIPLGLGIKLEARLASLRRDSFAPAEVAFNLRLPVMDGLPVKELIALRANERDAFENFQDGLNRAIREKLSASDGAVDDLDDLVREIQADEIDPALREIQRRLDAAKGVLRKNHRFNIAIAGLATVCGLVGAPIELSSAMAGAAVVGAATVESKLVEEERDIAQSPMYFLWRAKEYAKSITQRPQRRKRRGRR